MYGLMFPADHIPEVQVKRLVTTILSLCLMVPLSVQAEEAKHMLDANTLDNVQRSRLHSRSTRRTAPGRRMEASGSQRARPQHRDVRGADHGNQTAEMASYIELRSTTG